MARHLRTAALAASLVAALAACGPRPVGDFGRAAPSFTHDVAMPAAGRGLAEMRGEPVSDFNQTDQEVEMHDRVWRFLVAPHAKDWFYDFAIELQRTRIMPIGSRRFGADRYYDWLKETHYESSRVRYRTVNRDVLADIDTLPGTFAAICAVIEIDRQRAAALETLRPGPEVAADVRARKAENDMHIGWFVSALNYRYQSYNYALDHLLVETPHEESVTVDQTLARLAPFVERANRHDFCGEHGGGFAWSGPSIPSRYATQKIDTEVIAIK